MKNNDADQLVDELKADQKAAAMNDAGAGDHSVQYTENGLQATAVSKSNTIRTLDQLMEAAAVDLSVWRVASYTVNTWQVGAKVDGEIVTSPLWQVKARLVPNEADIAADLFREAIRAMRDHSANYGPLEPLEPDPAGVMVEIAIPDLHFGKWGWIGETGADYNMETAARLFLWSVEKFIHDARHYKIDRFLFPVGNDLFTIDNRGGTTTAGTIQDYHGTIAQHTTGIRRILVQAIDRLSEIAPVDVVIVPGNHDRVLAELMGEILAAWYRNYDRVTVDATAPKTKYYLWHKILIGFSHGDRPKMDRLPLVMATDVPELWGRSVYRELHLGHLHKKNEVRYMPLDEINGVRIRIIPSLSGPDRWHVDNGYVNGIRAAECYVWDRDHGMIANFSANINSRLREIMTV